MILNRCIVSKHRASVPKTTYENPQKIQEDIQEDIQEEDMLHQFQNIQ